MPRTADNTVRNLAIAGTSCLALIGCGCGTLAVGTAVYLAKRGENVSTIGASERAKLTPLCDLPKATDCPSNRYTAPQKPKVAYAVATETATSTATPTATATATPTATAKATATKTATKAPTPVPQLSCDADGVQDESDSTPIFSVRGFPKKVASSDVIFPPFTAVVNDLTKGVIGEPGVLLLATDAPQSEVDATGGSGVRIQPNVNQFNIVKPDGKGTISFQGGQTLFDSFQEGRVQVGGKTIVLRERPNNTWLLVGKTNKSGVRQEILDCVVSGHNQENLLPSGYGVSKGFFEQNVENAFKNLGSKRVSVFVFNEEDGTFGVMTKSDPKAEWEILPDGSNWTTGN